MSSSSKLVGLSLAAFGESVAGRCRVPGAGSVAAGMGALGAALASMAFRFSAGEGESAIPTYMEGRADELDVLRETLLAHVDRDAEAYAALREARPGGELQAALQEALEVPLEVAEVALAALRLTAVGAPDANPRLRCECLAAAHSLGAAVASAAHVADENACALDDRVLADDRRATLVALRCEAERLVSEIVAGSATDEATS